MKQVNLFLALIILFAAVGCHKSDDNQTRNPTPQDSAKYDICIYGGTSAGVIAAYTAKRMGKNVLLIEPGARLGGLSSGGLGWTDVGSDNSISGLSRDFYKRVGVAYGQPLQWHFEPKAALNVFNQYISDANITVMYKTQLQDVKKDGAKITEIDVLKDGSTLVGITAKEYIDCSYEGDLMAKAKVSYTIGREANTVYQERYNGVQLLSGHQFPDGIDPYKTPGQPASGLLPGISNQLLSPTGSGDKKIQAYNFRICLTNDPGNKIEITKPDNYDSSKYELLLRYVQKINATNITSFLNMNILPHQKTDINNQGPFSTDIVGTNYAYPDADYATRASFVKECTDYTKGLLYFIGHDTRMPAQLRNQMLAWGYPMDEFLDNNHFSPQLYIRESRRMIGEYIMTEANCMSTSIVDDGIAQASYMMDSHNCQRVVVNGMVKNEGNVEVGIPRPYPISYRAVTPKRAECTNLLVPVCLSASHIAYGSIRMEPVFMMLGQSTALAASLAIDEKITVQEVNISRLQEQIKKTIN